ncbi:unnamed protein product (mitochondrion) [Plasmodiophora brassicae]|uniref:Uncharacterized protein n=1 Tax=Plasmodiophora brassicae TaxID=37360 RepID=A0A3P3Y0C3_PLABS|nr:unnamed protein product [Plasmodiophora brassicae]
MSESDFQIQVENFLHIKMTDLQYWVFVVVPALTVLFMFLLVSRIWRNVERRDSRFCLYAMVLLITGVCVIRAFIATLNIIDQWGKFPSVVRPVISTLPTILQFFLFTILILILHASTEPLTCLADVPGFFRFHKPFILLTFCLGVSDVGLSMEGERDPSTNYFALSLIVAGSIGGICSLYFPMLSLWVTSSLGHWEAGEDTVLEKAYFAVTKSVARLGTVFSLFLLVQSGLTVLSGVSQATYSDHQVLFKYLFAACEIGVVWATMIFIWWQSHMIHKANVFPVSFHEIEGNHEDVQSGWAMQLVLGYAVTNSVCPCFPFKKDEVRPVPAYKPREAVKPDGEASNNKEGTADRTASGQNGIASGSKIDGVQAKPGPAVTSLQQASTPTNDAPHQAVAVSDIKPAVSTTWTSSPSAQTSPSGKRSISQGAKGSGKHGPKGEELRKQQLQLTLKIVKFLLQCMSASPKWQASAVANDAAEKKKVGKQVAVQVLGIWKKSGYPDPETFLTPWRKVRISIMLDKMLIAGPTKTAN